MDQAVARQQRPERFAFDLVRELAVDQQVRRLDEVRVLGELLDRITAVAQDALLAIEIRDRARRRARVHVAAVERDVARLRAERLDVDRVLVLGTDDNGKFYFLATGE